MKSSLEDEGYIVDLAGSERDAIKRDDLQCNAHRYSIAQHGRCGAVEADKGCCSQNPKNNN
jgi:hypothetical protein